jgi:hypothetical protein
VRRRKRGSGGAGGANRGGGDARRGGQVEQPRTDAGGVSAEGREQPPVVPESPTVPQEVADAPDTTTQKQQHEDPTKLEGSGDEGGEKSGG